MRSRMGLANSTITSLLHHHQQRPHLSLINVKRKELAVSTITFQPQQQYHYSSEGVEKGLADICCCSIRRFLFTTDSILRCHSSSNSRNRLIPAFSNNSCNSKEIYTVLPTKTCCSSCLSTTSITNTSTICSNTTSTRRSNSSSSSGSCIKDHGDSSGSSSSRCRERWSSSTPISKSKHRCKVPTRRNSGRSSSNSKSSSSSSSNSSSSKNTTIPSNSTPLINSSIKTHGNGSSKRLGRWYYIMHHMTRSCSSSSSLHSKVSVNIDSCSTNQERSSRRRSNSSGDIPIQRGFAAIGRRRGGLTTVMPLWRPPVDVVGERTAAWNTPPQPAATTTIAAAGEIKRNGDRAKTEREGAAAASPSIIPTTPAAADTAAHVTIFSTASTVWHEAADAVHVLLNLPRGFSTASSSPTVAPPAASAPAVSAIATAVSTTAPAVSATATAAALQAASAPGPAAPAVARAAGASQAVSAAVLPAAVSPPEVSAPAVSASALSAATLAPAAVSAAGASQAVSAAVLPAAVSPSAASAPAVSAPAAAAVSASGASQAVSAAVLAAAPLAAATRTQTAAASGAAAAAGSPHATAAGAADTAAVVPWPATASAQEYLVAPAATAHSHLQVTPCVLARSSDGPTTAAAPAERKASLFVLHAGEIGERLVEVDAAHDKDSLCFLKGSMGDAASCCYASSNGTLRGRMTTTAPDRKATCSRSSSTIDSSTVSSSNQSGIMVVDRGTVGSKQGQRGDSNNHSNSSLSPYHRDDCSSNRRHNESSSSSNTKSYCTNPASEALAAVRCSTVGAAEHSVPFAAPTTVRGRQAPDKLSQALEQREKKASCFHFSQEQQEDITTRKKQQEDSQKGLRVQPSRRHTQWSPIVKLARRAAAAAANAAGQVEEQFPSVHLCSDTQEETSSADGKVNVLRSRGVTGGVTRGVTRQSSETRIASVPTVAAAAASFQGDVALTGCREAAESRMVLSKPTAAAGAVGGVGAPLSRRSRKWSSHGAMQQQQQQQQTRTHHHHPHRHHHQAPAEQERKPLHVLLWERVEREALNEHSTALPMEFLSPAELALLLSWCSRGHFYSHRLFGKVAQLALHQLLLWPTRDVQTLTAAVGKCLGELLSEHKAARRKHQQQHQQQQQQQQQQQYTHREVNRSSNGALCSAVRRTSTTTTALPTCTTIAAAPAAAPAAAHTTTTPSSTTTITNGNGGGGGEASSPASPPPLLSSNTLNFAKAPACTLPVSTNTVRPERASRTTTAGFPSSIALETAGARAAAVPSSSTTMRRRRSAVAFAAALPSSNTVTSPECFAVTASCPLSSETVAVHTSPPTIVWRDLLSKRERRRQRKMEETGILQQQQLQWQPQQQEEKDAKAEEGEMIWQPRIHPQQTMKQHSLTGLTTTTTTAATTSTTTITTTSSSSDIIAGDQPTPGDHAAVATTTATEEDCSNSLSLVIIRLGKVLRLCYQHFLQRMQEYKPSHVASMLSLMLKHRMHVAIALSTDRSGDMDTPQPTMSLLRTIRGTATHSAGSSELRRPPIISGAENSFDAENEKRIVREEEVEVFFQVRHPDSSTRHHGSVTGITALAAAVLRRMHTLSPATLCEITFFFYRIASGSGSANSSAMAAAVAAVSQILRSTPPQQAVAVKAPPAQAAAQAAAEAAVSWPDKGAVVARLNKEAVAAAHLNEAAAAVKPDIAAFARLHNAALATSPNTVVLCGAAAEPDTSASERASPRSGCTDAKAYTTESFAVGRIENMLASLSPPLVVATAAAKQLIKLLPSPSTGLNSRGPRNTLLPAPHTHQLRTETPHVPWRGPQHTLLTSPQEQQPQQQQPHQQQPHHQQKHQQQKHQQQKHQQQQQMQQQGVRKGDDDLGQTAAAVVDNGDAALEHMSLIHPEEGESYARGAHVFCRIAAAAGRACKQEWHIWQQHYVCEKEYSQQQHMFNDAGAAAEQQEQRLQISGDDPAEANGLADITGAARFWHTFLCNRFLPHLSLLLQLHQKRLQEMVRPKAQQPKRLNVMKNERYEETSDVVASAALSLDDAHVSGKAAAAGAASGKTLPKQRSLREIAEEKEEQRVQSLAQQSQQEAKKGQSQKQPLQQRYMPQRQQQATSYEQQNMLNIQDASQGSGSHENDHSFSAPVAHLSLSRDTSNCGVHTPSEIAAAAPLAVLRTSLPFPPVAIGMLANALTFCSAGVFIGEDLTHISMKSFNRKNPRGGCADVAASSPVAYIAANAGGSHLSQPANDVKVNTGELTLSATLQNQQQHDCTMQDDATAASELRERLNDVWNRLLPTLLTAAASGALTLRSFSLAAIAVRRSTLSEREKVKTLLLLVPAARQQLQTLQQQLLRLTPHRHKRDYTSNTGSNSTCNGETVLLQQHSEQQEPRRQTNRTSSLSASASVLPLKLLADAYSPLASLLLPCSNVASHNDDAGAVASTQLPLLGGAPHHSSTNVMEEGRMVVTTAGLVSSPSRPLQLSVDSTAPIDVLAPMRADAASSAAGSAAVHTSATSCVSLSSTNNTISTTATASITTREASFNCAISYAASSAAVASADPSTSPLTLSVLPPSTMSSPTEKGPSPLGSRPNPVDIVAASLHSPSSTLSIENSLPSSSCAAATVVNASPPPPLYCPVAAGVSCCQTKSTGTRNSIGCVASASYMVAAALEELYILMADCVRHSVHQASAELLAYILKAFSHVFAAASPSNTSSSLHSSPFNSNALIDAVDYLHIVATWPPPSTSVVTCCSPLPLSTRKTARTTAEAETAKVATANAATAKAATAASSASVAAKDLSSYYNSTIERSKASAAETKAAPATEVLKSPVAWSLHKRFGSSDNTNNKRVGHMRRADAAMVTIAARVQKCLSTLFEEVCVCRLKPLLLDRDITNNTSSTRSSEHGAHTPHPSLIGTDEEEWNTEEGFYISKGERTRTLSHQSSSQTKRNSAQKQTAPTPMLPPDALTALLSACSRFNRVPVDIVCALNFRLTRQPVIPIKRLLPRRPMLQSRNLFSPRSPLYFAAAGGDNIGPPPMHAASTALLRGPAEIAECSAITAVEASAEASAVAAEDPASACDSFGSVMAPPCAAASHHQTAQVENVVTQHTSSTKVSPQRAALATAIMASPAVSGAIAESPSAICTVSMGDISSRRSAPRAGHQVLPPSSQWETQQQQRSTLSARGRKSHSQSGAAVAVLGNACTLKAGPANQSLELSAEEDETPQGNHEYEQTRLRIVKQLADPHISTTHIIAAMTATSKLPYRMRFSPQWDALEVLLVNALQRVNEKSMMDMPQQRLPQGIIDAFRSRQCPHQQQQKKQKEQHSAQPLQQQHYLFEIEKQHRAWSEHSAGYMQQELKQKHMHKQQVEEDQQQRWQHQQQSLYQQQWTEKQAELYDTGHQYVDHLETVEVHKRLPQTLSLRTPTLAEVTRACAAYANALRLPPQELLASLPPLLSPVVLPIISISSDLRGTVVQKTSHTHHGEEVATAGTTQQAAEAALQKETTRSSTATTHEEGTIEGEQMRHTRLSERKSSGNTNGRSMCDSSSLPAACMYTRRLLEAIVRLDVHQGGSLQEDIKRRRKRSTSTYNNRVYNKIISSTMRTAAHCCSAKPGPASQVATAAAYQPSLRNIGVESSSVDNTTSQTPFGIKVIELLAWYFTVLLRCPVKLSPRDRCEHHIGRTYKKDFDNNNNNTIETGWWDIRTMQLVWGKEARGTVGDAAYCATALFYPALIKASLQWLVSLRYPFLHCYDGQRKQALQVGLDTTWQQGPQPPQQQQQHRRCADVVVRERGVPDTHLWKLQERSCQDNASDPVRVMQRRIMPFMRLTCRTFSHSDNVESLISIGGAPFYSFLLESREQLQLARFLACAVLGLYDPVLLTSLSKQGCEQSALAAARTSHSDSTRVDSVQTSVTVDCSNSSSKRSSTEARSKTLRRSSGHAMCDEYRRAQHLESRSNIGREVSSSSGRWKVVQRLLQQLLGGGPQTEALMLVLVRECSIAVDESLRRRRRHCDEHSSSQTNTGSSSSNNNNGSDSDSNPLGSRKCSKAADFNSCGARRSDTMTQYSSESGTSNRSVGCCKGGITTRASLTGNCSSNKSSAGIESETQTQRVFEVDKSGSIVANSLRTLIHSACAASDEEACILASAAEATLTLPKEATHSLVRNKVGKEEGTTVVPPKKEACKLSSTLERQEDPMCNALSTNTRNEALPLVGGSGSDKSRISVDDDYPAVFSATQITPSAAVKRTADAFVKPLHGGHEGTLEALFGTTMSRVAEESTTVKDATTCREHADGRLIKTHVKLQKGVEDGEKTPGDGSVEGRQLSSVALMRQAREKCSMNDRASKEEEDANSCQWVLNWKGSSLCCPRKLDMSSAVADEGMATAMQIHMNPGDQLLASKQQSSAEVVSPTSTTTEAFNKLGSAVDRNGEERQLPATIAAAPSDSVVGGVEDEAGRTATAASKISSLLDGGSSEAIAGKGVVFAADEQKNGMDLGAGGVLARGSIVRDSVATHGLHARAGCQPTNSLRFHDEKEEARNPALKMQRAVAETTQRVIAASRWKLQHEVQIILHTIDILLSPVECTRDS